MKLHDYIDILDSNKIVCPGIHEWNYLYSLIEKFGPKLSYWEERKMLPLIMFAWDNTTDRQKNERFKTQLKFANEHGFFCIVYKYLNSLDFKKDFVHHNSDCILQSLFDRT